MKRKDQKFINKYKKDEDFENVLKSLNESLFDNETIFSRKNPIENYSNIHVIGVPRSGTTLVNQYLASCLDVGYINNLIATFWKVPIHGVHLSKKLLGTDFLSNFESDYGKTSNIREPHEFGYFWSDMLGFEDLKEPTPEQKSKQNLSYLSNKLINISNAFDKPVIYKSIFLGWSASRITQLMPKSVFVYVKRDWMDNALSLLKIREKYFQNPETWASFKPSTYEYLKSLSPLEQVVGQVYFLNQSFEDEISKVNDANKIIVNYEDFTNNPEELRELVISKTKSLNGKVYKTALETPRHFNLKNKTIDSSLHEELIKAYAKFNKKK